MPDKILRRSEGDKMVACVCAGVAKYFDVDPTLVRVGMVLATLFSAAFPGVLLYAILWLVMPADGGD